MVFKKQHRDKITVTSLPGIMPRTKTFTVFLFVCFFFLFFFFFLTYYRFQTLFAIVFYFCLVLFFIEKKRRRIQFKVCNFTAEIKRVLRSSYCVNCLL